MQYLSQNWQYTNTKLQHIRTYYYTGRYTENLINRIEHTYNKEKDELKKTELKNKIEKIRKSKELQNQFLQKAKDYYFFEIRDKPLQFSPSTYKIFQKGVDVQLAVDLVEFAYKNAFDIAVILSGDIDLIESIRTAKNLGKHVIIFGNKDVTAIEIRREADFFIDLSRLTEEQLNQISHIKKEKNQEIAKTF